MSFLPAEYIPYITYAAPPLIGAFIGYLTNRIAIRMLFRPLKAWRIFGMRVPMTPGVIPSRRHQLADNMGEVVGDHLLTSIEIGNALKEEKFQSHLLNVISERVGGLFRQDLPSIPELLPKKFSIYVDLGTKTVQQQLKEQVRCYIYSDTFTSAITAAIDDRLKTLLAKEVDEVIDRDIRENGYKFVESAVSRMLASPVMADWLETFIKKKVYEILQQEKTLSQILPPSLLSFLLSTLKQQTPTILAKLSTIFADREVRDKLVAGLCKGVENFISSLGPMAPMVYNFLDMETVEQKIREYFDEKEQDFVNWLASEELQERFAEILTERFKNFCNTPLVDIIEVKDQSVVEEFCRQLSDQLSQILQTGEVSAALAAMVRDTTEQHLLEGKETFSRVLDAFLGGEGAIKAQNWLKNEGVSLLRSAESLKTIDSMIDSLVASVVNKPVGQLTRLLPSDVREQVYISLQKITANMLEQEVPGLVDSLDIRTIIAEKLNSLDLLRLEGLLLSIMEEQFKYINLFGALLGFLIGCCNLLLISWY